MSLPKRILLWGALILLSVLADIGLFKNVLTLSLTQNFSTHIPLIPCISLFLLFRERSRIFQGAPSFSGLGFGLAAVGALVAGPWVSADISLRVLGVLAVWVGGFLGLFGQEIFRRALFPLLFLVLMVPIPDLVLVHIVAALQKGSAEASAILFKLSQTPHYRDGLSFSLPGVHIEIAPQCSSIRSSLALLISSLLASHLLLKTFWRKTALVLAAVLMAMIKNAIRIVVLTLLAVHVNKGWLTDSGLHQEGGIVFFILALLLLFPVFLLLRRSENKPRGGDSRSPEEQ